MTRLFSSGPLLVGRHDDCKPTPSHRVGRAAFLLLPLVCLLNVTQLKAELSAVWVNNGQDKVTRDELRASTGQTVTNAIWDGTTISLFGARNEVLAFNLILEAQTTLAQSVSVSLNALTGPAGATIASSPTSGNGVFQWNQRPIELFYVDYLEILGMGSDLQYENYDERHIPQRLRRPWSGEGEPQAGTGWFDRPDHNQSYPDIAVPLELVGNFAVGASLNQSIWVDIYIPKSAPAGTYRGAVEIRQSGLVTHRLPVVLTVLDFTLPDLPTAKTMVYLGDEDIGDRYAGNPYPACDSAADRLVQQIRDRHFLVAHRHRISLIDTNTGACDWTLDQPRPAWLPRLDGSLFTGINGYAGPGVGVGNNVFSIGTYGSWSWQSEGQDSMWQHTDAWESWFQANSPATERFLYLTDEPGPGEYPQVEQWAGWIANNPGVGQNLKSFCTMAAPDALAQTPALDIPASWFTVGVTSDWQNAVNSLQGDANKRVFLYNGNRPAGGSFAIEDDGVALRVLEWSRHKKGVDRWFFWESTYYNNYQGNTGQTNVFQRAHTFGDDDGFDPILGRTGFNYGNGDGVLFYPGTDTRYPAYSYGVEGPFASLRLKLWRRGIQDVEYLAAATAANPAQVAQIVNEAVPEVLWEVGVTEPEDPSYVLSDISWSTDPDDWEAARCSLARIIDSNLGVDCRSGAIFVDSFEAVAPAARVR